MRAAVYARFSSNLSRPTSIADQVHQCQKFIDEQGWTLDGKNIRSDSGKTGATLKYRTGLQSLIEDAKKLPPEFDCVLIDDTSRLGRNLTDVLRISEELNHAGVYLYFVSQGLDSRQDNFRQMLIMNGMVDEQYLVGLSKKVHRGQEGQILRGYIAGGKCYGYENVPIEDPSRPREHGRLGVSAVKQVVKEREAANIRRIADLFGDGVSYRDISMQFNTEGN